MAIKKMHRIPPPAETTRVALKSCANAPAGKAARGINPQVIMKMLIPRPVSAGRVLDIIKDMISVRNIDPPAPTKNKKAMATTRFQVMPKQTKENPNSIPDESINTPLRRKSPKTARKKDPQKAPIPAEDMRNPRPVSPALKIVLANTGISGK